jgi:hypothetical protein
MTDSFFSVGMEGIPPYIEIIFIIAKVLIEQFDVAQD